MCDILDSYIGIMEAHLIDLTSRTDWELEFVRKKIDGKYTTHHHAAFPRMFVTINQFIYPLMWSKLVFFLYGQGQSSDISRYSIDKNDKRVYTVHIIYICDCIQDG